MAEAYNHQFYGHVEKETRRYLMMLMSEPYCCKCSCEAMLHNAL